MSCESVLNFYIFGKIFGCKHWALLYWKKWAWYKLPLVMPVFGKISHNEELLNIRDNILQSTIRDRYVERQIRKAKNPVIVDCGINVGITVRWWFFLNPQATVYGIDMMQEANDFTVNALSDRLKKRYVPITAVLAGETGRTFEIQYNDALFGGNSIDKTGQYAEKRRVSSITLDDCLSSYSIDVIDFLKVDIEDSAAEMFFGASKTLSKVKNILLEVHSEKEQEGSLKLLREKGFCVRKVQKRHMWFEKISKT